MTEDEFEELLSKAGKKLKKIFNPNALEETDPLDHNYVLIVMTGQSDPDAEQHFQVITVGPHDVTYRMVHTFADMMAHHLEENGQASITGKAN